MRYNAGIMAVGARHGYAPVPTEPENAVREFKCGVRVRIRYNMRPDALTIVVARNGKAVYTESIVVKPGDISDTFIRATTIGDLFARTYELSENLLNP